MPVPIVVALDPTAGRADGGPVPVAVYGSGFDPTATVTAAGVDVATVYVGPTQLDATLSATLNGSVDVGVRNGDGSTSNVVPFVWAGGFDPPPPDVTWATPADVAGWVRVDPATAADDAELVAATDAANLFGFERRRAAGYHDDPAAVPGPRVKRGVVIYAGLLYRESGSVNGFSSFADAPPDDAGPPGTMAQVYRLLGTQRPVVG